MNLNPGSDDAVKAGCTCAGLGNNHGRGTGPFWMDLDCPIHGPSAIGRELREAKHREKVDGEVKPW